MPGQGMTCACVARYVWVWQVTRECEAAAQSDELTGTHSRVKPGLRCRGGLLSFIFGDIFFYLSSLIVIMVSVSSMGCKDFPPPSSSLVLLLFALESALLSLLLNDFLSASSKEPPPPRHLFALPPKGKIDTYWLNLIFINNRTSKKRSDIFLTFR